MENEIKVDVTFNPKFLPFFSDKSFYKILYGSAGCFMGATLIPVLGGYRMIRNIKPGDYVLSLNDECGIIEYKKVLNVFKYRLGETGQKLIHIRDFFAQSIYCTSGHEFYNGSKFVPISEIPLNTDYQLRVTDSRYNVYYSYDDDPARIKGRTVVPVLVEELDDISDDFNVYDLEVEDNHNYCITKEHIVVHNSGKSYAISQKIVKRCIEERGHRVWAFRKVATTVEQSVYDTIRHVVQDFGVTHLCSFNMTKKIITFNESDSVIRCAGLDDQEKIKSIREVSIAWMEEMTEFDEQDFNQLDLRMRGMFPYYRELIGSFNPVSELHWIKSKFFDNVVDGINSKLFTLHTTFKDNIFLEQDYIERLENTHAHDPNNYRVYVLGVWGKVVTGMEYYKNFHTDKHTGETELDNTRPVHITFDFNVVPYMTATIWQIHGSKDEQGKYFWDVHAIKEVVLRHPKNSTEDMCEELIENYSDYVNCGVVLYGDATGRNRKTSSKKTDWMIIQEMMGPYQIDFRVPRSNPMQSERNGFINRLFYGSLPVKILINKNMKFLIEDLTHSLEDGDRNKIKQKARDPLSKVIVEKFGHLSDGMDYLLCAAFKDMMA